MKYGSILRCLIVIFSFITLNVYSQQITFHKIYDFNTTSILYSVQQTPDSGYIASGSICRNSEDAYILKLDKIGDTIWTKSYGYSLGDQVRDIQITSDGGYIVTGRKDYQIDMEHGNLYGDIWILKLNARGDTIWSKTYGGPYYDFANSIKQTSDGGYIVAGTKNNQQINSPSDIWILRLDQNGDTLWTKTFSFSYLSEAKSIIQTTSGDFVFTGTGLICKLDNSGDLIWSITQGSFVGNDIIQTTDSDFVAAGFFNNSDDKIIKLDSDGNTIWEKLHFPNQGFYYETNALALTESGDIVSVGQRINSNDVRNYPDDLWVKKNLADGTEVWTNQVDLSLHDIGYAIVATNDKGFVIAGVTNQRAWLLKLDQNFDPILSTLTELNDNFKTWNYPNPFSGSTTIYYTLPYPNSEKLEIEIFNSAGNMVKTIIQNNPMENHISFKTNNLPHGVYFYKMDLKNGSLCKKMIIIR